MKFKWPPTLPGSRRASAGVSPNGEPAIPPDLAPIADLLAVTLKPGPDFVRTLEARLLELPAPGRPASPVLSQLTDRILTPRLLRRLAIAAALVAVAVVVMVILGRNESRPTVANANVLADAAAKLLDAHTVRYRVRTEVSHGVCSTVFNAPLTEADKAVLVARGDQPVDTGIVYGCWEGPQVQVEDGVYDLDNQAFSATMQLVQGETGIKTPSGPGPYDRRYRMYVDGKLYTRQEGGEWRVQPTQNRWMPFTFLGVSQGVGQVPAGNLDALKASYDQVLKVGEEKIEGVKVAHYRASRTTYAGPETVEAWIGIEDGLPRRAVVVTETENSEEWNLKRIADRLANPDNERYRDDPIVRRGEWPAKSVITWTYTFEDFNEPVRIETPIP